MKCIVLTSCFKPLLCDNISNHDVMSNVRLTHDSVCRFLSSSLCHSFGYKIFLVDCSDYNLISDLCMARIHDLFVTNPRVNYVQVPFTPDEILSINVRGKGFSELLMLKKFLNRYAFSKNTTILKSSARYIPLISPSLHFPFLTKAGNSFAYSRLFRKAVCHSYFCNVSFLDDLISFCLDKVNDNHGKILENLVYEYILLCNFNGNHSVRRSSFYPFYNPKVQPGTASARRFSSSLPFQIFRSLAVLF